MDTVVIVQIALLVVIVLLLVWLLKNQLNDQSAQIIHQQLEEKHRAMLLDLHDGLNQLSNRLTSAGQESDNLLQQRVSQELNSTREAIQALQLEQTNRLGETRETMIETLHKTLSEQTKSQQAQIHDSMLKTTTNLTQSIESLSKIVDTRLEEIGGKVTERLEEGFKKTNETFVSVMERLAKIDKAQETIEGLSSNVVSLQALLGDKRSRGAFGEVQLEGLVRNILPNASFKMQHTFENGTRADCALFLPQPTGTVAVDSKFPLENYHRMLDDSLSQETQAQAAKQFKQDIKKHVDDIASKYIIPNVTSDGAVMFIPAEAVFAEIHAYHPDIVEYAMAKKVWMVSPTTLMAVLNTARAVLKDVEMRKQVHIIKEELAKLSKDFGRFDTRMKKLADHIRQANQDAQEVHTSSQKISKRFQQIERVEVGSTTVDLLDESDI